MLKPAELYIDEINKLHMENWYNPDYMYYTGGTCRYNLISNGSNNDGEYRDHKFVSIDKNGKLIGYISYTPEWKAMSVNGFGAVSFDRGNIEFARDIYQAINDIFYKFNLNRIEFGCFDNNPALRGYRNFIKKFGGRECAHYRECTKLIDGKLHGYFEFEILKSEYKGKYYKEDK